jgi:hypothetical protein
MTIKAKCNQVFLFVIPGQPEVTCPEIPVILPVMYLKVIIRATI